MEDVSFSLLLTTLTEVAQRHRKLMNEKLRRLLARFWFLVVTFFLVLITRKKASNPRRSPLYLQNSTRWMEQLIHPSADYRSVAEEVPIKARLRALQSIVAGIYRLFGILDQVEKIGSKALPLQELLPQLADSVGRAVDGCAAYAFEAREGGGGGSATMVHVGRGVWVEARSLPCVAESLAACEATLWEDAHAHGAQLAYAEVTEREGASWRPNGGRIECLVDERDAEGLRRSAAAVERALSLDAPRARGVSWCVILPSLACPAVCACFMTAPLRLPLVRAASSPRPSWTTPQVRWACSWRQAVSAGRSCLTMAHCSRCSGSMPRCCCAPLARRRATWRRRGACRSSCVARRGCAPRASSSRRWPPAPCLASSRF